MKNRGPLLAYYLLLVSLNGACDTFASPPDRSGTATPTSPAGTSPAPSPSTGQGIATTNVPTAIMSCSGRLDSDGDGYSVPDCPAEFIAPTTDRALDDCDDFDASRHVSRAFYVDADGDGRGAGGVTRWGCEGTSTQGLVDNNADCTDKDRNKHTWVTFDGDGDQFGGSSAVCGTAGDGFVAVGGDCADGDPAIHPEGVDIPFDGVDGNCDGYDIRAHHSSAPSGTIHWTEGALCQGGQLAVVALTTIAEPPGGVHLHIANIGTETVSNATLVLRKVAPTHEQGTVLVPLPPITPAEAVQTDRIYVGHYEASIQSEEDAATNTSNEAGSATTKNGSSAAALDAGPDSNAGESADAESLTTRSSGAEPKPTLDSAVPNGTGSPEFTAAARCENARKPFEFVSVQSEGS
jgi:hypothetical protein